MRRMVAIKKIMIVNKSEMAGHGFSLNRTETSHNNLSGQICPNGSLKILLQFFITAVGIIKMTLCFFK